MRQGIVMGKMHKIREENELLSRLLIRLLPVQAAIIAMSSVNTIVDGVVAARFIDASTVGVIGLYYSMLRILEASGAVLLGGVTVLSGRYLGSGKIEKTRGITSLGLALAFLIGAFLTAASFLVPGTISDLLGANRQLRDALSTYVRGYAIGIIPQLMGQQLASTLQLERKEKLGQAAIGIMIACNVLLDILFVVIWDMGIWGLALSTSLSNWAYFLVVGHYYLTKQAQLKPSLRLILWREIPSLVKIGFPNALLVICLAGRSLILNRLLLTYSGNDGLNAASSFFMIVGLLLAVSLGAGGLVRMLSSVFLGEDNRESLLSLIRIVSSYSMILVTGITILTIALSSILAGIFYPDRTSEVFRLTRQLIIIYGCGFPAAQICIIFSNYYQAAGHLLFANLISVVDGFLSSVIPALILAPRLGATGVWLALLIGLFITLGVSVLYPIIRGRRIPRCLDEWLLLPEGFGSGERIVLHLKNEKDVAQTSEKIQAFCTAHHLPGKTGFHAALCLEEMAANIVRHGFHADRKHHDIEVRLVLREKDAILRIKDDCIPFNPQEWYEMATSFEDPFANIGIRMVMEIADEVGYQNILGLNVLTMIVSDSGYIPDSPRT